MDLEEQHVPSGEHTTPGQTLRAAREAGGMSIADVAQALKLSPRQVEAIESDDYERLSGPTFVRGFVRNYARLMRLDAAQLVAGLDAKASMPVAELRVPEIEGVRMPSGAERTRVWTAASLIAGVLLVIALILYFDLVDVSPLLNGGSTRTVVVPPVSPRAVEPDGTSAGTPTEPVQEVPGQPAPVDATPLTESTAPAVPPAQADPDLRRLVFSFEGPSWVEVKDAAGQVLLSQLNPAGSEQVVEGRAPLSLIIGNADTVRLEANAQPVDLRPHTRVQVARLTIP